MTSVAEKLVKLEFLLSLKDTTSHRIRRPCLRRLLPTSLWKCKHCGKVYRTKHSALGHDCEAMKHRGLPPYLDQGTGMRFEGDMEHMRKANAEWNR